MRNERSQVGVFRLEIKATQKKIVLMDVTVSFSFATSHHAMAIMDKRYQFY